VTIADDFARLVTARRQELGLSQTEVARRMKVRIGGWFQQTVARTESGDRPVRLDEAVALADALEMPLVFSADALTDLANVRTELAEASTRLAAAGKRVAEQDRLIADLGRGNEWRARRTAYLEQIVAGVEAALRPSSTPTENR
jgi:transcriptional regulator with XRE-family HTH domain